MCYYVGTVFSYSMKALNKLKKSLDMSTAIVHFKFETETKNSIRYKEVPEPGKAPIMGSLYVQKWFAGETKEITLTIEKKE